MDELLPTPTAGDGKSSGSRNLPGSKAHPGVSLTDAVKTGNSKTPRRTSRSSPASEDSTSESKPSGSDASARSSGTETAQLFSTDGGPGSHGGEMSQTSPLLPTPKAQEAGWTPDGRQHPAHRPYQDGQHRLWGVKQVLEWLTSSSEGSPASPSAMQAGAAGRTTSDTSGLSSIASSSRLGRAGSSSRTSPVCSLSDGLWVTEQASLFGSTPLATFSATWPRRGSMRSGVIYELPPLELPTDGSESSSSLNVPTPTASDSIWAERDSSRNGIVGNHNLGLVDWVRTLPSPNARDWKGPRVPGSRPGDLLPDTIEKLLPTPKTPTGGPENRASKKRRGSGGANLEGSLGDLTRPRSADGSR